jgi:hypothetical protein
MMVYVWVSMCDTPGIAFTAARNSASGANLFASYNCNGKRSTSC